MEKNIPMFSDFDIKLPIFGSSIIDERVIKTLTLQFNLTSWGNILISETVELEYNKMSLISLFKALALPYLLNISSERALTKIISSYESIQHLCGFYPNALPKERTFWHFRNKYKKEYSEILLRLLINLVLSGREPNYNLPFVSKIDDANGVLTNNFSEIPYDCYRSKVFIQHSDKINNLLSKSTYQKEEYKNLVNGWRKKLQNCINIREYDKLVAAYNTEIQSFRRRHAEGFLQELSFPIDVVTNFQGGQIAFRLTDPAWFEEGTRVSFSLSSSRKPYNKACNVIVIRGNNGKKEILLSQRKETGYGQGEYAIPGGKQKEGESLQDCAKRELLEETNLMIRKSHPVSLYLNKNPDDPLHEVLSVGVLVEEYDGEVETAEVDRHVKWQWFDIDNVPSHLFEPTRIALVHFLDKTFPDLTWEDVEKKREEQLPLFDQKKTEY